MKFSGLLVLFWVSGAFAQMLTGGESVVSSLTTTVSLGASSPSIGHVLRPTRRVGEVCSAALTDKKGGTTWTQALKVVAVSANDYLVSATTTKSTNVEKIHYTSEGNVIQIERPTSKLHWSPYRPDFHYPLVVGKEWRETYRYSNPVSGEPGVASAVVRVEGWEEISLPGKGKVLALKITSLAKYYHSTPIGEGKGINEDSIWVTPEIPCVLRRTMKSTSERSGRVDLDLVLEHLSFQQAVAD